MSSRKPYTQAQLDAMNEHEISSIVINVAYEVQYSFITKRQVDTQIRYFMENARLSEGLMLRRDFDGVTEAKWMVKKMIGEFLAFGKPNI